MQALVFNVTPMRWLRTKMFARLVGRRAYWSALGCIELRQVDPPELPGPGWVMCRTRLGGLCGSDLAMLLLSQSPDSILQGFCSMPMIPGHENVAEVVQGYSPAEAEWVGRRICVEPTLCCGPRGIDPPCRRCALGEFGSCENFGAAIQGRYELPAGLSIGYNGRTGGAWGEYFVAHVSQLVPVPHGISDEQALLTDPLACSLHAVLRTCRDNVEAVCVYGGGVVGLGVVASLRAVGYEGRIDLVGRYPFQRELAEQLGATSVMTTDDADELETVKGRIGGQVVRVRFGGQMLIGGYDVVYDCVGAATSLTSAVRLTRARGQVVLIGTCGRIRADLTPVWFRELSVVGVTGRQLEHWRGRRVSTYELTHELLLSGNAAMAQLVTHTFPLAEFRRAFAAATDKIRTHCVKAALRFA